MSDLLKKLQKSGLPPMPPPPGKGPSKRGFGGVRRRDYSPLSWQSYYHKKMTVKTDRGEFIAYTRGSQGPLVVCLHGGGFSALSWAVFSMYLTESAQCCVMAFDQRGHGETNTPDNSDLAIQTLASDVGAVISAMYEDEPPSIILIGHSMGGSVAVHAAIGDQLPTLIGLIVVDVVEGTAMEALNGMKSFLRGRPAKFKSLEQAIEWSVRSGQIKNNESARVSMIGQVKPVEGMTSLSNEQMLPTSSDTISEENEDSTNTPDSETGTHTTDFKKPVTSTAYEWRIDLENTEQYWPGWFEGLSSKFLSINVPKVLLLAGVDRLDKTLSIGQMQGKFQMQVVDHVGHVVHEDAPHKVADVVATFLVRNRFAEPGESFTRSGGCCITENYEMNIDDNREGLH